ncbi:uncharacterized protein LOC128955942 [Oppia nitens]|uniref:uncharacterized protein LOC128955942 n=1 Tax=Oppia nitens TaxID=1686743 RepID=UPI0023DB055C|nr:uncharacterized protein LOC128955942 [Oppia nitens]
MPFIQRNLFPRRPPMQKCNGPSILQSALGPDGNIQHKRSKSTDKKDPKPSSLSSNKKHPLHSTKSEPNMMTTHTLSHSQSINHLPNLSKQDSVVRFLDTSDPAQSDSSCAPNSSSSSSSIISSEMISRRRILSRSRDALNINDDYNYNPYEEEDDIWFNKDKLFKNHIQEVLVKWDQIDDEIWAKVICMERNRRVAKAYARAPVLTVNGCDNGFDGYRIGLNGFDNPMRDPKTEELKRNIGLGVKVKMDDEGNVLVKRLSKTNVYVKGWTRDNDLDTSVSADIIKANGLLEIQKSVKLFDMKKFQTNVCRELKNAYPDRRKLEDQCICCIAFVKDATDLLEVPVWVMIINIVALDMLKSKLPPIDNRRPNQLSAMFERSKSFVDENPYAAIPSNSNNGITRNGKHGIQDRRPPRLPPRDGLTRKHAVPSLPKPDYETDIENQLQKTSSDKNNKKYEDPYYCGFKARIPNFAKRSANGNKTAPAAVTNIKPEPPILKKANSKGLFGKLTGNGNNNSGSGGKGGHYGLSHSESDGFLCRMNGSNSVSSGYVSGSNTNSIRSSDNNDIYGINNRKLSLQSKYGFNLKPNQMSSIKMHQMFSPRSAGPAAGGFVVGDWE